MLTMTSSGETWAFSGVPECLETPNCALEALRHRQKAVQAAAASGGPGPVDLVLCCKRASGSNDHGRGFFHHVLGHDITSTASAAAYFAQLCNRQEQVPPSPSAHAMQPVQALSRGTRIIPPFKSVSACMPHAMQAMHSRTHATCIALTLSWCKSLCVRRMGMQAGILWGLFGNTAFEVHQCYYCSYDAILQLDVQCCMSRPGGIHAQAKNGAGQKCAAQLRSASALQSFVLRMRTHACAQVRPSDNVALRAGPRFKLVRCLAKHA